MPARRFYANGDGTFRVGSTPRAWLAWECQDGGPDPLPQWKRYCQELEKPEALIGATLALFDVAA